MEKTFLTWIGIIVVYIWGVLILQNQTYDNLSSGIMALIVTAILVYLFFMGIRYYKVLKRTTIFDPKEIKKVIIVLFIFKTVYKIIFVSQY